MPPKRQTRLRIAAHVRGFPTRAPIAVDDKTPLVQFLEVDEARGDGAGREGGGGEADGLGLTDPAVARESEPGMELIKRRGNELRPIESAFGVLVRLGVDGGTGRCD